MGSLSLSGLFACMFFSSNNNTAFAQQQRQLLFSLTSLEELYKNIHIK